MALSVNITINAQDDAFTPLEGQLLQILAGTPAAPAPAEEAPAEKPATPARKPAARKAAPKEEPKTLQEELAEDAEEAEEAPAEEKPTPAQKPARKAAPKKEAPAEDEDLIGDGGVTLQDAVQMASKAVSEGRSADVKKALAEVGAGRVSHLKGDAIVDFINALNG